MGWLEPVTLLGLLHVLLGELLGTLGGVWSDKGKLEGKNGILFTLNNKQINTHLTGISISNGLTWSLDNKTFYYIDSSTGCLEQYDCDITNGTISKTFKLQIN